MCLDVPTSLIFHFYRFAASATEDDKSVAGCNVDSETDHDVENNRRDDASEQEPRKTLETNMTMNTPTGLYSSDFGVTSQGSADLYDFVPASKLRGPGVEREELFDTQYGYMLQKKDVVVVPDKAFTLPPTLKAYTYQNGDLTLFPKPRVDANKILNYYLMDASSVLPVIALDLKDGNTVLDLCAAPGGKALSILQARKVGGIVCNDAAFSRLQRLQTVLKSYVPETVKKERFISVSQVHGEQLGKDAFFDRVLVDVPCTTDRQMVLEEENNWFSTGRTKERLQLPEIQMKLLCSGIRAVKPGGVVVYSTCTLSQIQNDGVVQMALQYLWENSSIDVIIKDLTPVQQQFGHVFKFHNGCRYGQLVVPSLMSNFGPMYFCKIERLK